MFEFVPFSPPGSPCSSNMDNNDIGVLGSVNPNPNVGTPHTLGVGVGLGPGQGQGPESASSLQSFFFSDYSGYSTLCDWAGGNSTTCPGIIDHHSSNAKTVLPPYECFGENGSDIENSFSFLPTTSAVMDPWNNVHDLVVARPGLDGLEDSLWPSGARVAAPYA